MTNDEMIEALQDDVLLLNAAIEKSKKGELKNIEEADAWLKSMGYDKKRSEGYQIKALHLAEQNNCSVFRDKG